MATKIQWNIDGRREGLETYRSGANLKIVLCRPRNGNALTRTMITLLTDAFRNASADSSIARIILTATGRFFCTGMDLGKSTSGVGKSVENAINAENAENAEPPEFRLFTDLFHAIQAAPQVTIAAITGPCYAGGIGLAFSCDVRFAVSSATAALTEVRLGLCPAIISKHLVREWGTAFAREAMLSGRAVRMTELKQIGAVHGLAQDARRLHDMVDGYVADLRGCAPGASSMCKSLVRVAGTDAQDEHIRQVFVAMMKPGAESSVGVRDFQRKRKTDWDGLASGNKRAKL